MPDFSLESTTGPIRRQRPERRIAREVRQQTRAAVPLLSDPDGSVIAACGARGLLGVTQRVLVLIGLDRRIRWRRSDLPVFHRNADELREVIAGL